MPPTVPVAPCNSTRTDWLDSTDGGRARARPGLSYLNVDHPYAADLDLFGAGSLFERLCTARTRSGEDTLAAWLLAPASPEDDCRAARRPSGELRPQLDLREDLELLGVEVRQAIDPAALAEWGTAARVFPGLRVPLVALILGVLGTAALVGWLFFDIDLVAVSARSRLRWYLRSRWSSSASTTVLSAVERRTADLVLLSEMLHRLETHPFEAPLLRRLVKSLETDGHPASSADQAARPASSICSTTAGISFSRPSAPCGYGPRRSPCASTPGAADRGPGSCTGSRRSVNSRRSARWRPTPRKTRMMCFPQIDAGPAMVAGRGDRPPVDRRDAIAFSTTWRWAAARLP